MLDRLLSPVSGILRRFLDPLQGREYHVSKNLPLSNAVIDRINVSEVKDVTLEAFAMYNNFPPEYDASDQK